VREQQFKQIYSIKRTSDRIVFSVEEVLINLIMVFLSLVQFFRQLVQQQKMDGVASATKDHRARIKSIQKQGLIIIVYERVMTSVTCMRASINMWP